MKLSDGFSRVGYNIITVFGMILRFYLLSRALKDLPMSLAYPIWTGIGAIGTVIVGVVFGRLLITFILPIFGSVINWNYWFKIDK